MATKSRRSAGSQFTERGVTQGTTLVGPQSGLPIDEVVDGDGTRRLAVDAVIDATGIQIGVDLDVADDGVHIGDPETGYTLEIQPDGSINVNVQLDATDGDNVAIHDSDGHELQIEADGSINVNIKGSGTPVIKNITTVLAATEYSYAFPANTKRFKIKARGNAKLQLAFISGQSGVEYITIFPGSSYIENDLTLSSVTAYFQSTKANEVVEICSWG